VAHSLSAKKRIKQNAKQRTINRARKSQIKTQADAAAEQLRVVTKKLDKTAATSTMHKKTAARKKSRLAKRLNALTARKG